MDTEDRGARAEAGMAMWKATGSTFTGLLESSGPLPLSLGAGSLDGLLRQERLLVAGGCAEEQGLAEDCGDKEEEEEEEGVAVAACSADGLAWTWFNFSDAAVVAAAAAWLLQLLLLSLPPSELAFPFSMAESCGLSELRVAAAAGEPGCDWPVEPSVPRGWT